MASTTSGSRKLKKNSLPKFEAGIYANIPSGELIVFAVHYLLERQSEITLEDVVSICFRLFPHKFGLKKYPRWPDSALVGRRWGDARRKRHIVEDTDTRYRLTVKGLRLIKKVEKGLGIAPKPTVKVQSQQPAVTVLKKPPVIISKKKTVEPTQKIPVVIEKKKATLIKEAKAAQVKKVVPASAPVISEIKKTQPIQKKKITSSAPVKKINLASVKKTLPAPVKQIVVPEVKVQAKKTQPIQKKKITSSAPVKKINPVGVKKISPAPVKQTVVPEIKVQVKKTQPIQKKKITSSAPVKKINLASVKKTLPAPVKQTVVPEIKIQVKKTQPVQKKKITSSAPVKKINPVGVKKISPAPVKQTVAPEIKIQVKKTQVVTQKKKTQPVQEEKATQLELISAPVKRDDKKVISDVLPIQAVKKSPPKKEAKPVEPVVVQLIKQTAPSPISKEAKERAGKFTRMMERSDAYVHYKKNGSKANINEFDFRSLLLCTMESSAETLARNVELFKGYAEIQQRQDLILFLGFCEEKFSHLLKPQSKSSARKTKK